MSVSELLGANFSKDRFDIAKRIAEEYEADLRDSGGGMDAVERYDFIIGFQLGSILSENIPQSGTSLVLAGDRMAQAIGVHDEYGKAVAREEWLKERSKV